MGDKSTVRLSFFENENSDANSDLPTTPLEALYYNFVGKHIKKVKYIEEIKENLSDNKGE